MSSTITNIAPREAGGEPDRDIVQHYKTHVQALGYSPSLAGKCIRTILHLITWLSLSGIKVETLDIRVLHHFLKHDCVCPGPQGLRREKGGHVPPKRGGFNTALHTFANKLIVFATLAATITPRLRQC